MSASLRFTTGVGSGREVALADAETKIGRDPSLQVVIPPEDHRFVSRVHAAIVRDGERYVLHDLGSSNGTYVNGKRVDSAVLADGDELRFGRHGPTAHFTVAAQPAETVLGASLEQRVAPPPAPPPPAPAAASEPPRDFSTQVVRRIVGEALATNVRRSRRRLVAVVLVVLVGAAMGAFAVLRSGLLDSTEQLFGRLADKYQGRVVLVEVGVSHNTQYVTLGNGTGFFAAGDGFIITNKHVVQPHLFDRDSACVAASFPRNGLSYEKAVVIAVWPGGSDFRQTPTSTSGDRSLGYSTDLNTLALVGTAPDTLGSPLTIQCRDIFTGQTFPHLWQPHLIDNHDLAVLRATKAIDAIPLADGEPDNDDDVMVLGFPRGLVPLETNKAEPIRRVGNVLRTRDTIQIDAVVLGGNSGGPLIDRRGEVVGVTTRGTAESLNMAIKVEHVRRLLERIRATS